MTPATLPRTIRRIDGLAKRTEYCVNLFNAGENKLPRPGVNRTHGLKGDIRGIFKFKDNLFVISSDELVRIDGNGITTVVGNIVGSGHVDIAISFTHAVICARDVTGEAYLLNDSFALTLYSTITNYVASKEVEFINGRFVFIPLSGDPAFHTNALDPLTIDALSFFDAEAFTDENKGIIDLNGDLYLLGSETMQPFRNTGQVSPAFRTVNGATVNIGYIGAKTRLNQGFAFIGKEREQGYGIYMMQQGQVQKISTPEIDTILHTYTLEELGGDFSTGSDTYGASGQRFVWQGHDILVFSLPNETLAFSGGWDYFSSGNNLGNIGKWNIKHAFFDDGRYIVGDQLGNLGYLDDGKTDFFTANEFLIRSFARDPKESVFTASKVQLRVSNGEENTIVYLSVSRDGTNYGNELPVNLSTLEADQELVFWPPGGLGRFTGYMGYQIRTAGIAQFSIEGVLIGFN